MIKSTTHNTLLPQLLPLYSQTLSRNEILKPEFDKFCGGCHLHSPMTTSYTVVGKHFTLCVQIVWLLDGAYRHDTTWKPALFTSSFLVAVHQGCFYQHCNDESSFFYRIDTINKDPDSTVHGVNMGPTWVLLAPDGTHVGPMNLAIRGVIFQSHVLNNALIRPPVEVTMWRWGIF